MNSPFGISSFSGSLSVWYLWLVCPFLNNLRGLQALNALTRKDRYPIPLINDTLERISKATWFTKLDVIAAFHKLWIEDLNPQVELAIA